MSSDAATKSKEQLFQKLGEIVFNSILDRLLTDPSYSTMDRKIKAARAVNLTAIGFQSIPITSIQRYSLNGHSSDFSVKATLMTSISRAVDMHSRFASLNEKRDDTRQIHEWP